ncbi:MAG: hypothetical protein V4691_04465 [Pseudomonadota bacterium]
MQAFEHDKTSAAAYIAMFLPELKSLAETAGHDVLSYLLNLAESEARQLCDGHAHDHTIKPANYVSRNS